VRWPSRSDVVASGDNRSAALHRRRRHGLRHPPKSAATAAAASRKIRHHPPPCTAPFEKARSHRRHRGHQDSSGGARRGYARRGVSDDMPTPMRCRVGAPPRLLTAGLRARFAAAHGCAPPSIAAPLASITAALSAGQPAPLARYRHPARFGGEKFARPWNDRASTGTVAAPLRTVTARSPYLIGIAHLLASRPA